MAYTTSAQNILKVVLMADDRLSGALGKVRSQIDGLGSRTSVTSTGVSGLWGAFGGTALAVSAVQSVTAAFGKLGGVLEYTSNLQAQILNSTNTVATNMGTSWDKASEAVEKTQLNLAKVAAALPGETKDYQAVFQSLSLSTSKLFKDPEQFEKESTEIAKRVGALASISKADPFRAGQQVTELIEGLITPKAARRLEMFKRNPQFTQALFDTAAQMGVDISKGWSTVSEEIRYKIVKTALEKAAPDSLLQRFVKTPEALFRSWQTSLFDPLVGAFGFLRKVDMAGGRTAFDALFNAMTAFDNLGKSAGTLLAKMGIRFDPMEALIGVLDFMSDIYNNATLFVQKMTAGYSGNLLGDIELLDIGVIMSKLGQGLTGSLTKLADALGSPEAIKGAFAVGAWASKLAVGIAKALSDPALWVALVRIVLNTLQLALSFLFGWLWDGIRSLVRQIGEVFSAIANAINGAIRFISNPIQSVTSGLAGAATSILSPITNAISAPFKSQTEPGKPTTPGNPKGTPGLPKVTPGGKTVTNSAQVTVNATTGASPEAISGSVVDALTDMWDSFNRPQLVPGN